jgi:hypothetical protein
MALGTTNFSATNPATPDDSTTIPSPVNECVALLGSALSADANGNVPASAGYIYVTNASATIPSSGWFVVGREIISYTGKSGSYLTGCTRGAQSTTIAIHPSKAPCYFNFTAQHLQVMIDAIIAIEQYLTRQTTDTGLTSGGGTLALTKTPVTGRKVLMFVNGLLQHQDVHFTLAGTVITFVGTPPDAGLDYAVYYTATT